MLENTLQQPPLKKTQSLNASTYLVLGVAFCVLAPVLTLLWHAFTGDFQHWIGLLQNVIPNSLGNTLILLVGVAIVVACLGTGSAWLTTAYQFPTRSILMWALLLPLAVPTYIMAFAYLDVMHPLGPIQSVIRDLLGYTSPRQFRLPDIRSMGGAIVLLGFVLYPYVYLSTRVMFMTQAANLIEAARTLGCTRREAFFRVVIPMARPAIAVGISLALLETLNDIGASEFLGIQTLTVSVYTTWISRSNLAGAAQIAIFMLIVVTTLIWLERHGRQRQRYANTQRMHPIQPQKLHGIQALIAMALGWFPVICGFIIPAIYLVSESIKRLEAVGTVSDDLIRGTFNTITVAAVATLITVMCGLLIVWVVRNPRFTMGKFIVRASSLGYAIPGTVLAIGLLTPYALIDTLISDSMSFLFQLPPQLYIMGSMSGIIIAYVIRFMAISVGGIEAGLARIPPSLENASRILGQSSRQTFYKIHLPLLKPAIGAASLLIFVDAMKELSATLLLRPLNFETLSTWLYAEAARGTYEEGAIAALIIVLAGLLPVIILAKSQLKSNY
ncbi:ABC transporter permease [Advenella sp. RU8]|uniref:ABC transporter permease n=1 Tax=Advenella sp. RU8 TaxID=3399575 RepID=UPI003AAFEE6A